MKRERKKERENKNEKERKNNADIFLIVGGGFFLFEIFVRSKKKT